FLGLGDGDGGPPDLGGEAGAGVHFGHDLGHRVQDRVGGVDHHVDALAEDVQVGVGDQRGDLDQGVFAEVEAGHLAVDPHQIVGHPPSLTAYRSTSARAARAA